MTPATTTRRTIPDAPDPDVVHARLERALGDAAHGTWARACREVGLDPDAVGGTAQLITVLEVLASEDGLVSIVALSQLIRCRTTLRLRQAEQER